LRGSYSWNDSRIVDINPTGSGNSAFYPGMSLQQVPTHTGSISVNYAHGPATVSVITSYVGQSLQKFTNSLLWRNIDYSRIKTYGSAIKKNGGEFAQSGYSK